MVSVFGTVLNGANWLFLTMGLWLTKLAASPSWATLTTSPLTGPVTVAYIFFCLLISDDVRRRFGFLCLRGGLVALNVQVWNGTLLNRDRLDMHVLDVGQGDAVFIRFPNGRTMLVDGRPRTRGYDAGERIVLPFLRHLGVRRIDVVVGSHPHSDHIGGLISVLEEVSVGRYIDAGQPYDSWMAGRIEAAIESRGIEHVVVAAGDSLSGLGGWVASCFSRPPPS
jgi:beta-lactamase superfamily II metal-dependent hydrolase